MDNVNAIAAQYEGKVSANVNAALESIKKRERQIMKIKLMTIVMEFMK